MKRVIKNISDVPKKRLCMSCGTCAAICPSDAIMMRLDTRHGLYAPIVDERSCAGCGTCREICPGLSVDFKDLSLKIFGREPEDPWLGNYLGLHVGHASDDEIRRSSSSGGLVTALLLFALGEGVIQGAIG